MKSYFCSYTLNDGSKGSVNFNTDDIKKSLEQYERNRDIKNWDIVREKKPGMFHF